MSTFVDTLCQPGSVAVPVRMRVRPLLCKPGVPRVVPVPGVWRGSGRHCPGHALSHSLDVREETPPTSHAE